MTRTCFGIKIIKKEIEKEIAKFLNTLPLQNKEKLQRIRGRDERQSPEKFVYKFLGHQKCSAFLSASEHPYSLTLMRTCRSGQMLFWQA